MRHPNSPCHLKSEKLIRRQGFGLELRVFRIMRSAHDLLSPAFEKMVDSPPQLLLSSWFRDNYQAVGFWVGVIELVLVVTASTSSTYMKKSTRVDDGQKGLDELFS